VGKVTATPIDTPGSTFSSTSEPIDFTCTTTPVAISVGFGSTRTEERVYRDGAFLPGYKRSTANAGTFSIVRDGGWPANPQIYIDEPTAAPTGGQAMAAIYEVDFRTLANQTIGAAGSYTIDGKVWWAKGSLTTPVPMSSAVVNGSGLRLSTTSGTALALAAGSLDYAPRMMVLPLANLTDFNPLAPILVRAKFASASVSAVGWVGLIDTTSDAANYLAAKRSSEILSGTPGGSPSASFSIKRGTASVSSATGRSGSIGFTDRLVGVQKFSPRFGDHVDQAWTGAAAVPAASGALPQDQGLSALDTGTPANPCVAFFLQNQSGSPLDVYMTHLSISQPKVP
jgi:hypothetical protein